jgi:hypothetical protein
MTLGAGSKFDPSATAESLSESAFDFLERALSEFESSPKFSTIHFSTAVELFLKARLMREHWVLVLDQPDKASRRAFADGSTRTVTMKGALDRLNRIVGLPIPEQATAAFASLAEHRNRMIHFVHEAAGTPDQSVVKSIAKEQSVGWFHLRRLLREWHGGKPFLEEKLAGIEARMRRHKTYLEAAFSELQPDIERLKSAGMTFSSCESCGLKAAAASQSSEKIRSARCMVCGQVDWLIALECPDEECGLETEVRSLQSQQPVCKGCGHVFLESDFKDQLDTEISLAYDVGDDPINCAHCASHASVIKHQDHYICAECRSVEEQAPVCGWCNERQIGGGSLEHSEWSGCEFCEGRAGWEDD